MVAAEYLVKKNGDSVESLVLRIAISDIMRIWRNVDGPSVLVDAVVSCRVFRRARCHQSAPGTPLYTHAHSYVTADSCWHSWKQTE